MKAIKLRKTGTMASGKATTRKLTGRAKDNFFESALTPEEAKAAVTSLQVRKEFWPVSKDLRPKKPKTAAAPTGSQSTKTATESPPTAPEPAPGPTSAKATPATASPAPPPPQPPGTTAADAFDPFVFGLVPVFKREGASGLAARLKEIDDVENLRAMAKAQQIVLPRDVRRGDVTIEAVRSSVLTAVEQRVTDRKAQL